MSDELEQEIRDKGLTAPRVTLADIEAAIAREFYATANRAFADDPMTVEEHNALSLVTICVLVLKNGFKVVGDTACVSPENFDAEIGRKVARQKAVDQLWPLLGYTLKERLYRNNINQSAGRGGDFADS